MGRKRKYNNKEEKKQANRDAFMRHYWKNAEKIKKKISWEPNQAAIGRLRMLSMAPVIKSTKEKVVKLGNEVFLFKVYRESSSPRNCCG